MSQCNVLTMMARAKIPLPKNFNLIPLSQLLWAKLLVHGVTQEEVGPATIRTRRRNDDGDDDNE